MENLCLCLEVTVTWGFSSPLTQVLWKFTLTPLVNPANQYQGHLLQIVFLQQILYETNGQTPPLHNG